MLPEPIKEPTEKKRGRTAGEGTLEAREMVNSGAFERLLATASISEVCKARILKAVKFNLGIK